MFPRNNASLVRSSSGFSPQARIISLSWSILFVCVLGLIASPARARCWKPHAPAISISSELCRNVCLSQLVRTESNSPCMSCG